MFEPANDTVVMKTSLQLLMTFCNLHTGDTQSDSGFLPAHNSDLYDFMSFSLLFMESFKGRFSPSLCCLDVECSAGSSLCAYLWPHHISARWPLQNQDHVSRGPTLAQTQSFKTPLKAAKWAAWPDTSWNFFFCDRALLRLLLHLYLNYYFFCQWNYICFDSASSWQCKHLFSAGLCHHF